MNNLPMYVSLSMMLITFLTVAIFYKASNNSKLTLAILLAWPGIQAIPGISGFYTVTNTIPPRFALAIVPPVVLIVFLFATPKGRRYIDSLNLGTLTALHAIRIPVELVLFALFVYHTIPELMTFEGRNPDILSGLTAPVIFYFYFIKRKLNRSVLLIWNLACLGLLVNIVAIAILAAPLPFQKLAFEQPNIAVLYFPFVWLPSCIVPLVLLSHLASIRQILRSYNRSATTNVSSKPHLA